MARRGGLIANLAATQGERERQYAAEIRAQAAAAREAQRAQAAYERAARADERERKRHYQESRAADVAADNSGIESRLSDLNSLLAAALTKDDYIDLETFKRQPSLPVWHGRRDLQPADPPQIEQFMPPQPSRIAKIFGAQKKYETAVAAAQTAFTQASAEYQHREAQRLAALKQARAEFDEATQEAIQAAADHNEAIDAFRAEFEAGKPDAVVGYFDMVLQASDYPPGFPHAFKLAYVPDSHQVVVEYELPDVSVVPAVKAYRYVKSSDSITETARPKSQITSFYTAVLAQITLRTLHEIFEADRHRLVDVIVFNGMLNSIDRSTGQPVHPCVISVRATRDTFSSLDLANVDPIPCLNYLSAAVSRSLAELVPVRPILEFSMVDPRVVAGTEVSSELDQRPNLMELTPNEFESLIQDLFTKMGLDTKHGRRSRAGGVGCVAYDTRAVLGGKVVIQAKRYKKPVGVSAVRDLFGTVMNEGASKGILITTSGYGKSAFEFANDKPLELLDGAELLALLAEHAHIEAKIILPDDWHDSTADT